MNLCGTVYVHFRQCTKRCLHPVSAAGASDQRLQVGTDQKSTMNESSSTRPGENTRSSGQQMKMENCYHLLCLFKYMQAGRSWWMPCVYVAVDMIKKKGDNPPYPPPFTTIIDKQMCAGKPANTENCLCAKLPLRWEILFICCTSPIMFLSPSRLLMVFYQNNKEFNVFFSVATKHGFYRLQNSTTDQEGRL